jgi:hypothetical protein
MNTLGGTEVGFETLCTVHDNTTVSDDALHQILCLQVALACCRVAALPPQTLHSSLYLGALSAGCFIDTRLQTHDVFIFKYSFFDLTYCGTRTG